MGLDRTGSVIAISPCAERMLDLRAPDVVGRRYVQCLPPTLVPILDEILANGSRPRETRSSLKLETAGAETELMVTASPLGDESEGELGTVLFFEDVSQSAQRQPMEASRAVARRIEHEYKNPLTQMQLSTER